MCYNKPVDLKVSCLSASQYHQGFDLLMTKIFLIDDDEINIKLTSTFLRSNSYEVETAHSAQQALTLIFRTHPDLIITDVSMPGISGIELCRILRTDARTALTPVIFISSFTSIEDKVACFEAGGDDYLTKPVDLRELLVRIIVQLRKVEERGAINSLTQMPGGKMVESVLQMLVQHPEFKFAVLYIDIDSFKVYNDYYGFARGNQVIMMLADVLREVVNRESDDLSFAGHIGGDDFLVISSTSRAEDVCRAIIAEFDARIPELYDRADRERGYIRASSRQGRQMNFPIVSISIGVISNEHHRLDSVLQIGQLSAEVKHIAKLKPGSSFYTEHPGV
jgi:diguanylate cyclase (GGDEF)-like protein